MVGARMTRKRLKALRYPKDLVADVSGWSSCICASTGTPTVSGPTPRCGAT